MKRVLITGMSASGKSSVVQELVARGYKAAYTDDDVRTTMPLDEVVATLLRLVDA